MNQFHNYIVMGLRDIANAHPNINPYYAIYSDTMGDVSDKVAKMARANITQDTPTITLNCQVVNGNYTISADLGFAFIPNCQATIVLYVNCGGANYSGDVSVPITKMHAQILSAIGNIAKLHPELGVYHTIYKNAKSSVSAQADVKVKNNPTAYPLVIILDCAGKRKPTIKVGMGYHYVPNSTGDFVVEMNYDGISFIAYSNKNTVLCNKLGARNQPAL